MSIEIVEGSPKSIERELEEIKVRIESQDTQGKDLPDDVLTDIKLLLSDASFRTLQRDSTDGKFLAEMNYTSFCDIHATIEAFYDKLNEIKERVDVEIFLKDGYRLDAEAMIEQFKNDGLEKQYPNFKLDRLVELYRNPPEVLSTLHSEKQKIEIDEYAFRKYVIAIIQMVFNQMDLVISFTGGEGSGKSVRCSQDMFMVWWILTEIGIINYSFNIKEIFKNTLKNFREAEDKYFHERFRIIGLDEGNELNRQNWREPEVETFFQRLRRERYNQRIKFICIPVIGEMIPNIVLTRVNFIFDMKMSNKTKTGTLKKGDVDMYIIPRADRIYSPYQKREITKEEIKEKFYEKIKDKSYLSGLPESVVVHKFKANGVWAWPKELYYKVLKETNETFSVSNGISLSELEAFYLYKADISVAKNLRIKQSDIMYSTLTALVYKIANHFEKNPDLMLKYEALMKRKLQRKKEKKDSFDEYEPDEMNKLAEDTLLTDEEKGADLAQSI